ncbi:UDP-N-acetylglucosamine 2-epimerase (non-hydrolyzing) [soil metagenome]
MNKKVIIFGTRAEFIKLIPIFNEIKKREIAENFVAVYTGQHADLNAELFGWFDFQPDFTIALKNHNNSLSYSYAYILVEIQKVIDEIQKTNKIGVVLGQGDTTSCVASAMCAFFNEIPFGHIEAGLRTNDLKNPYPEEYFCKIISLTSTIHFAPTLIAQENLLKEGIKKENILLTGNTIVDSIELIKTKKINLENSVVFKKNTTNCILITCHRRENQNDSFNKLIDNIKQLAEENTLFNFIWLSHTTPFIERELNEDKFKQHKNISILPPLNVFELYKLYENTRLIITDSGGLQEEAPSFNIPVIVIRESTERVESIKLGYSSTINQNDLVAVFTELKDRKVVDMVNPYGDGKAAERIVNYLKTIG